MRASGALGQHLFFERLHETGLANTSLTTEQHHLAGAFFGLRPAPLQDAEFFLASHQRR